MKRLLQLRCFYKYKNVRSYSESVGFQEQEKQNSKFKQRYEEEMNDTIRIGENLFNNSTTSKPISLNAAYREGRRNDTRRDLRLPRFTLSSRIQKQERTIRDAELEFEFIRLDLKHPTLTSLMTAVRSRKRSDINGQIVVEGRRLIREAIECNLKMRTLIFSSKEKVMQLKEEIALLQRTIQCKIYKVPHHDLKTWSTLTTPPGVLAIFERPAKAIVDKIAQRNLSLPITVVCDNIRDPSNLGSVIRTCAAIPCQGVIVTKGCCDPWESKVLRGGCGAHFRIPIKDDIEWKNLEEFIPPDMSENCCIFVAENNLRKVEDKGKAINYTDINQIGTHNIVIIGGESHGVSEDAYKLVKTVGSRGRFLHIPLENGIDSLNVASAITLILYELKKMF